MTERKERYPPAVIIPPARPSDPRRIPTEVFDLRPRFDAMVPDLRRRKKIRTNWRRRPVMRKPADVRYLLGHQMAVTFGVEGERFAERAAKTAYHVAVSDDGGEVALVKPFLVYANHGGYANGPSVGMGIEGTWPGEERRRGRKHTQLTPGLDRGIRVAMERVLAEIDLEAFAVHRQSSADRAGDPGEQLFPCMADHARALGLRVDLTTTWHDGRPIPAIWGGPTGVPY